MLPDWFVFVGLAIAATGSASYIVATLRGTVQPNRLSFLILSIAPMVAFAAEIQDGVGVRAWITFWFGFSPLLVFLASFVNRKAYWKLTRFDFACGALAIVALLLWAITGDGNVAIVLSVLADFLAALPILVKAWKYPHTEQPWLFLCGATSAALGLLVLNRFTLADLAFPTYILIFDLLVVAFLLRPRTGRAQPVATT